MEYDKDSKFLDWEMQNDDNFDYVADSEQENEENSDEQRYRHHSDNWIQFTDEKGNSQRFSGDGLSNQSFSEDEDLTLHSKQDTAVNDNATANDKQVSQLQKQNSYTAYLPEHCSSRFKIMDEDELDLASFDGPMEFRGTLKTGDQPYKSNSSCFCSCIRYFIIIIVALVLGLMMGYYIGLNRKGITTQDVFYTTTRQPTNMTSSSSLTSLATRMFTEGKSTTSTTVYIPKTQKSSTHPPNPPETL